MESVLHITAAAHGGCPSLTIRNKKRVVRITANDDDFELSEGEDCLQRTLPPIITTCGGAVVTPTGTPSGQHPVSTPSPNPPPVLRHHTKKLLLANQTSSNKSVITTNAATTNVPAPSATAKEDRSSIEQGKSPSTYHSCVLDKSTSSSISMSSAGGGAKGREPAKSLLTTPNQGVDAGEEKDPSSTDALALAGTSDSMTSKQRRAGSGLLASRRDLALPQEQFAAGCNLMQAAARGDRSAMEELLSAGFTNVNFRDYDRRTALHVAAGEGRIDICNFLIEKGAKINRSDRWGGSPLDDAHRHRHQAVVDLLRQHGGKTGSGNKTTNLMTAAACGDVDEVIKLVQSTPSSGATAEGSHSTNQLDINKGDYDNKTALHLAAGEGHAEIVRVLCEAGADVDAEDRWMRRPLDDAHMRKQEECIAVLERYMAVRGKTNTPTTKDNVPSGGSMDTADNKRVEDSLKIDFGELTMIDKIGTGAFGEIYKCSYRGTLVAAKIIKSSKIRRDWVNKRVAKAMRQGMDVDEAVKEFDDAEVMENDKDLAIDDFRREISLLKSLRHPHIVLMLAYSTTENYECLISELMKCSLLDVFKSHLVQGTRMAKRTQIVYATQLALGMNYLHTCKPPIVHRDLKPANLLIDHSGVLKISDFGLSKVRPDPNNATDKFTMTGETGSYRFMAPEVFRHEPYNEMVDVYSYAMILYYLLVGRPPWPTLSGVAAVKRASEDGDRPTIPRDMDVRMQTLIRGCWDENPSLRPKFDEIAAICSKYNRDVFHQDANTVLATAPPPLNETKCCCTIL